MSGPLHTVHAIAALKRCIGRADADAALLLLEEAVYCALAGHRESYRLAGRAAFVLTEALAARGLDGLALAPDVTQIDMKGFVALTVAHSPIVGWF